MIRYLILLLALLPLACSSCTPVAPLPIGPEPPQPDPTTVVVTVVDAGPEETVDASRDTCARACGHLRHIGCPDGNPTPTGTSCEQVCRTDKADPVARLTSKYLACLATVKACADEARCAR